MWLGPSLHDTSDLLLKTFPYGITYYISTDMSVERHAQKSTCKYKQLCIRQLQHTSRQSFSHKSKVFSPAASKALSRLTESLEQCLLLRSQCVVKAQLFKIQSKCKLTLSNKMKDYCAFTCVNANFLGGEDVNFLNITLSVVLIHTAKFDYAKVAIHDRDDSSSFCRYRCIVSCIE